MRSSNSRGVVLALALAAELALDRLHLLVEVVLALGPLHLRLDPALDLLLDLEDGHLALHQAVDRLEPVADVGLLEQLLLVLELGAEMAGHRVGELRRRHRVRDRRHRLLGDVPVELGVALELLGHGAAQRLDRRRVLGGLGDLRGLGLEIGLVVDEAGDPHPHLALDQHLHGAVGQLQQLQHVGQHADAVDALGLRLVLGGVLLAREQDLLVVPHHRLERAHRLLAADEQRHDHVRKHHDVAQGQDGIGRTAQFCHGFVLTLAEAPGPGRSGGSGRSLGV